MPGQKILTRFKRIKMEHSEAPHSEPVEVPVADPGSAIQWPTDSSMKMFASLGQLPEAANEQGSENE